MYWGNLLTGLTTAYFCCRDISWLLSTLYSIKLLRPFMGAARSIFWALMPDICLNATKQAWFQKYQEAQDAHEREARERNGDLEAPPLAQRRPGAARPPQDALYSEDETEGEGRPITDKEFEAREKRRRRLRQQAAALRIATPPGSPESRRTLKKAKWMSSLTGKLKKRSSLVKESVELQDLTRELERLALPTRRVADPVSAPGAANLGGLRSSARYPNLAALKPDDSTR